MQRKDLLKASELLGLKHPKNIKTDKLKEMVSDAMAEINLVKRVDDALGTPNEPKVFKGYHPITGEPV